jgi:hypothetical protein
MGVVNISFADGAPFRFFAASFGIPVAELAFETMIESSESGMIQRCSASSNGNKIERNVDCNDED